MVIISTLYPPSSFISVEKKKSSLKTIILTTKCHFLTPALYGFLYKQALFKKRWIPEPARWNCNWRGTAYTEKTARPQTWLSVQFDSTFKRMQQISQQLNQVCITNMKDNKWWKISIHSPSQDNWKSLHSTEKWNYTPQKQSHAHRLETN